MGRRSLSLEGVESEPRRLAVPWLASALCACTTPTFPVGFAGDAARGLPDAIAPEAGVAVPVATPGGAGFGGTEPIPPPVSAAPWSFDGGGADDAQVNVAPTPSWTEAIRGRYAKGVFHYGFEADGGVSRMTTLLALATIDANDAGQLRLVTEPCAVTYEWPSSTNAPVDVASPRPGAVRMEQRLRFGADRRFTLENGVLRIGFDVDRLASCAGVAGTLVGKSADQSWLPGSVCHCPVQLLALPSTRDDCRLTDPDGDLEPGITMRESRGSIVHRYALALEHAFYGGAGELTADGDLQLREQGLASASCVDAQRDGCGGARAPRCEITLTQLVRFDQPDATCVDVLSDGLSRIVRPSTPPSRCEVVDP